MSANLTISATGFGSGLTITATGFTGVALPTGGGGGGGEIGRASCRERV